MGCRHCGRKKVNRPKGLCWPCYYSPARNLYASTSKFARRGVGHDASINGRLPVPTTAKPGTPEKMAVLAGRVERGELMFHPADATE